MTLPISGPRTIEDGIHPHLRHQDYLALDAFSSSGAKKLLRSPAHYLVDRQAHRAPTPSMLFGTAVHTAVLEPEAFGSYVARIPEDAPPRPTSRQINAKKPSEDTVKAIEFWRIFDERTDGCIVIDSAGYAAVKATADAIRSHDGARRLLELDKPRRVASSEVTIVWTDPAFGIQCKARLDYWRSDLAIVDIKTAEDASPTGFPRSAASFMYHVQAALYLDAVRVATGRIPPFFAIVAAEKEPPYAVATYVMPSNALLAGRRLLDEAMGAYKLAVDTGNWFGYPKTIEPLEFPKWAVTF